MTLVCAAVAGSGCKSTKPNGEPGTGTTANHPPVVSPINPIQGKVALVNSVLKYAVIDFSLGRVPQAGQTLNVYRQGQKVGELKVSEQARDGLIAADIAAGEVAVGDLVRED